MKNLRSGFSNLLVFVLLVGLVVVMIALFSTQGTPSAGPGSSPVPTLVGGQVSPLATSVASNVPLVHIGNPVLLQASGPMETALQSSGELIKAAGEKGTVLFDLSSGLTRTLAATNLGSAHATGHWLVYQDQPSPSTSAADYSRIKIVDLNTGEEILLGDQHANQQRPQISGNLVVWIDWRNREKSGVDIYGYDLTTRKEFPVVVNPRPNSGPKISGQWVIYVEPTDQGEFLAELRAHSVKTNEDFTIGIIPAPNDASNGTYYAIDNDKVVWSKYLAGGQQELHLYDLTTRTDRKLLNGGASDLSISAKNGIITFPGGSEGWVILDWFQPTPEIISVAPPVKLSWGYILSIAGDYLVWQIPLDHDQTNAQIFAAPIMR